MNTSSCELCSGTGGRLIHDDGRLRVVIVDEADYPGFIRVIWNAHVREMTDLPPPDRAHLMQVVFAVERLQREALHPHKMNLASLGNVTPHVHWHLIPRFSDDAHYPAPIWSERKRTTAQEVLAARRSRIESLVDAVVGALRAGG